MWTPEAHAALRAASHTAIARVDVWRSGKPVATLVPTGGTVAVEADSPVRRSLSCELVDPTGRLTRGDLEELLPEPGDLVGGNVGDLLNAYECEIAPYRGVRVNGHDEYEPLGVFRLTRRDIDDGRDGLAIALTGQDRAIGYQVPMTRPLPINAGVPVEEAIRRLLSMVQPGLSMHAMRTGHTVGPLLFPAEIDVWAEAQKLAESVGARLFHDRTGQLVLAPAGAPSDQPVAAYSQGDGLLLVVAGSEDSDTINNVVVAESEDGSIRVVVEDDNPASPTFVGRSPRSVHVLNNPYFGSVQQATQAATARLVYELGRFHTVNVTVVPDAGRDVDEVISVHRPRSGLVHRGLVVARLDIPLAATKPMRIGCRQSRLAQDGRVLPDLPELAA